MVRAPVLALLSLAPVFWAATGYAEPAGAASGWSAPAECPRGPNTLPSGIHVEILRAERGWSARIDDLSQPGNERVLVGRSCEELTRAALLTVSLLEQARSESAEVATQSEGPNPPPPEPGQSPTDTSSPAQAQSEPATGDDLTAPPATAESRPQPPPRAVEKARAPGVVRPSAHALAPATPHRFGLAALVGGLNEGGSVWTATAGVLANVGNDEWFVLSDARLGFATIQREVTLDLQWASLSAGLCRRWAQHPALFACAASRLDVLRGVAPTVTRPTADLSLLPAVQFLVGARWPLAGRFALLLVAEAHLRVRGAHFEVEPLGEIYSFPKQGFSLVAGPEARF